MIIAPFTVVVDAGESVEGNVVSAEEASSEAGDGDGCDGLCDGEAGWAAFDDSGAVDEEDADVDNDEDALRTSESRGEWLLLREGGRGAVVVCVLTGMMAWNCWLVDDGGE